MYRICNLFFFRWAQKNEKQFVKWWTYREERGVLNLLYYYINWREQRHIIFQSEIDHLIYCDLQHVSSGYIITNSFIRKWTEEAFYFSSFCWPMSEADGISFQTHFSNSQENLGSDFKDQVLWGKSIVRWTAEQWPNYCMCAEREGSLHKVVFISVLSPRFSFLLQPAPLR